MTGQPWFLKKAYIPESLKLTPITENTPENGIPSMNETSAPSVKLPPEFHNFDKLLRETVLLEKGSIQWTDRLSLMDSESQGDAGWRWIVTAVVASNRGSSALRAVSRLVIASQGEGSRTTVSGLEGKSDGEFDPMAWIAMDMGAFLVNVFQTKAGRDTRLHLTEKKGSHENVEDVEIEAKREGRRLLELAYAYGFRQNPLTRKDRVSEKKAKYQKGLQEGDYTSMQQSFWAKGGQDLLRYKGI